MKNGADISKYKPVDYESLQAIIDAKRLETDALREKVIFLFSVFMKSKYVIHYIHYLLFSMK